MEQVRVNLVASNHLPVSFWAYAANHAADVLNRTAGPPDTDITSYEVMTSQLVPPPEFGVSHREIMDPLNYDY